MTTGSPPRPHAALHAALADYTECVVIAPDQERSGASSSLTLDRPLHPQTLANGCISVNGTPTDCVHLGVNGARAGAAHGGIRDQPGRQSGG